MVNILSDAEDKQVFYEFSSNEVEGN